MGRFIMRSMKTFLPLALVLLAGCAGTPPAPPAAPATPTAPAATQESAAADNQTAADRRFADETRSYKLVERNGQKYYCRAERPSGSNLRTNVCWTESELRQRVDAAEAYRRKYKASVCENQDPRCGGA